MNKENLSSVAVLLVGTPQFLRKTSQEIQRDGASVRISTCAYAECWSTCLSERPQYLVLEIGRAFQSETLRFIREALVTIRERLKDEVKIVLALTAPQTLFAAGELLFEAGSLDSSGLINDMVAIPPFLGEQTLDVGGQIVHILKLDYERFTQLGPEYSVLPTLNSRSWVPSLGDPASRELWCRWLPRFALYLDENPLIIGPTGTGKTNLARAIHTLSRRPGEFISITPRDFSSSELVQAELFGAVEGAYTGAVDKWGLVRSAQKGTLFIDELQSIDKDLQGKLITFIENKVYRRVGDAESVSADVRFVFASNRSLVDMMEDDTLRHDFAYRLERVLLQLLPLKERPLDIITAAAFSLAKIRRQRPHMMPASGFEPQALDELFRAQWLGNLRQLENAIAKACELVDVERTHLISQRHIVEALKQSNTLSTSPHSDGDPAEDSWLLTVGENALRQHRPDQPLSRLLGGLRKSIVRECYNRNGDDLEATARELGEHPNIVRLFLS